MKGQPRTLVAALSGAALAVGLTACQGTTAQAQLGVTCDQFQATPAMSQTAEMKVGDELAISLCSNPSTGFAWQQPEIADATVVKLVDSAYHEPGATLPVVGAAGGQVLTVHALGAGTTNVLVKYSRPWTGGEQGVWTYNLAVTVR